MRRGSISTYADDSRRTSAVVIRPERRNTVGSNSLGNRQEFSMHEENEESPKGMFVTFRSIAFVFVFLLAIFIGVAFVGFFMISPPEDEIPSGLEILTQEEEEQPVLRESSASIAPLRYVIELEPVADAEKGRVKLKGRVDVLFQQSDDVGPDRLTLNSRHLHVKDYRLHALSEEENEHLDNATSTELKITGNKTDEANNAYVIILENPLHKGNYSLEIEYEATVDENVIFMKNLTKNGKDVLLLVSKLKPVNAPRLFPTLDEAKLKASFVLTLLHSNETKVLSNTPLTNSSDLSESLVADEFAETPRMSAYNLAFVEGGLEHLGDVASDPRERSVAHWTSSDDYEPHEFYLQDKLGPVLGVYEQIFTLDRPTEKLDLVALPLDFDGLSVPGLIAIKESLFYAAVGSPSLTKTKALLNLIGLVGQQWLGGLVDAKNWTDAWYIEGTILYLQYELLDKIDQSLEASDNFLVDVQLEAMENDGYLISKALSFKVEHNRVEAFDLEDNYRKGACLISMLHAILGASSFASGYAGFLRRWSYSSADADAFLRALAGNTTIDGESTRLHDVFQSWTRQPGYPLINVKWNRDNGTVVIRQQKFNFDEFSNEDEERMDLKLRWWVPLTYVTAEGNWSNPSLVWLKGKEEITLENIAQRDNDSWIVFNVDKKGYYRVNYDSASWRAISWALLTEHADIPAATRAALIDDALSLARQGSLGYETALELLSYLGNLERDYAPWRALARHAHQLDLALYETPAYPNFQEFMRELVSSLFDEMRTKIDQGSALAVLAIRLACLFENQKCTNWARNQWENVLRDGEYALAKHVRETVYCVGAQRGSQEELTYLTQKYAETSDRDEKNRLLSALGCFQTPWILHKVLNEILEDDKYDEKDIRVILKSYAKNPAAAQVARRFVQDNWKEIVERFSNSYWTMKAFVEASTSMLFTEHDLKEFNDFRDKNIDSLKAMGGHWVALNEMKASSWIFRLKQSSESLLKWFKNHSNYVV